MLGKGGSRGLFRGQSGQTDNREEKSHRSVGPSLRRKSAAAAAVLLDDRCNITQKPSSLRRRSWSFSVAIWTQDKSLSRSSHETGAVGPPPFPPFPPDLNGLLSSSFPFGGGACIRALCGIRRGRGDTFVSRRSSNNTVVATCDRGFVTKIKS